MSVCNRDLCRRHIPVVVNAINRLANQNDRRKYIVLDLTLPATIDKENYGVDKDGVYNYQFPRFMDPADGIDITNLDSVSYNGTRIGTDGFYITPTMRYTKITGTNGADSTMNEYVVLDNNNGYPKAALGDIQMNPRSDEAMLYLERTTKEDSGKVTSTIDTDVTTPGLTTNIQPLMFKINIPWSMSIFYENMSEKTQREYDKLVSLMDSLTRFTEMRVDFPDEDGIPRFEAILPFKNYASSNQGKAVALTMAGSVNIGGFNIIGDTYWRFYPGGFVFISQGRPYRWQNKHIILTLAYED